MPARGRRPWYQGGHDRHSRVIRAAAHADPTTRCPTCGLTLAERRATHPKATWDAGHLLDSTPGSPLIAQCSHCNRSQGAHFGNVKRAGGYDW
jgi:hypothetical protein